MFPSSILHFVAKDKTQNKFAVNYVALSFIQKITDHAIKNGDAVSVAVQPLSDQVAMFHLALIIDWPLLPFPERR